MATYQERVEEIGKNLDGQKEIGVDDLHPNVIDSCMENVRDVGLDEDADGAAFWGAVWEQLTGELDAFGYSAEGLRP